jgi:archaemetzincin
VKDFEGLGYRPGKACVASSFRLNKENLDEHL